MARTLILGAGFGGIAAAVELRRLCDDDHDVVLVDRAGDFSMGLRKLWEAFDIGTIADGSRPRSALARHGIDFRRQDVESIDLDSRSARVGGEEVAADFLVVALGAVPRPDMIPGLAEHGHDLWDKANVPATHEALNAFDGGRISVVIAGGPYPCPPAAYECALLLDEWLRVRGLRESTTLDVTTFQPILLPNAGKAGSAWLGEQLSQRGIAHRAGRAVERVEAGAIHFEDGEEAFDLLIGIPPHRPPAVVEGGFVKVDPGTFETGRAGVFAVGDVTQVTLSNGLPLPKAGGFAEAEGVRVARAIAARAAGAGEPPPFDGHGECFIEMGRELAALVELDLYADPEPIAVVQEPDAGKAADKRRFEAERLAAWFGG